ncbi:MAG TPA: sugar ABC transporter ATP-binding protein [Blastocatellia bacterium]|nr:sugar ABC transporter ATP-binding protein [Blastocatellia bacterium]
MALIELRNISKHYGATTALDSVDFQLEAGEVHALIGENGAGKSTLMNVIAGLAKPDAGNMTINNRDYSPANPMDARRHGIALIHQELSLCPHLTVAENVLLGTEPAKSGGWLDRRKARQLTAEVLETFNHPSITPDRPVSELPIAARQVVEICRAIAARASIILMDEPTSSLQGEDIKSLFSLIRRLREQGISVIYISHFLEEIREVADRYTVFRDGRHISTGNLGSTTDEELVAQMVGRPVQNLYPARERSGKNEIVLEVRDLSAPGVKQASFELRRGEVFGVAGLMGSGRSELVRALYGLAPIDSGQVNLQSNPAGGGASPSEGIKAGFGYLSEDRKGEGLASALSIADNVTLTKLSSCSRFGWLSLEKQHSSAARWIGNLGIRARDSYQPVADLSGGNQQKTALARLFHQDADILLLDEPTRGIDIGSKAQIYEAIVQMVERNRAVLFVSSYLPELFGMCDRLAVMCRGRLSAAKAIGAWTPESVLQAAIGISSEAEEAPPEAGASDS